MLTYKRTFSLLFFLMCWAFSGQNTAVSQQVAGDFKPNPWVLGGDFGIGFSSFGSNILVSPQLGYKISPRWEAGLRLTYNFYSFKDAGLKYSSHNYGGGLYTSYDIYKGLFAHVENELLSYNRHRMNNIGTINKDRILIHSFFVGGGFKQYFTANSYASLMLLYNLNETFDTPYQNPMFRIGFGFGL